MTQGKRYFSPDRRITMTILLVCIGFLASAMMAAGFSGVFKRLFKTGQDFLLVGFVGGIYLILGGLLLTGLGLFLALFSALPAFFDDWVVSLMAFGFYGGLAVVGGCCLYLFLVRLPLVASPASMPGINAVGLASAEAERHAGGR